MRRWNGWGDDSVTYPLHQGPRRFLEELVGSGESPIDATLLEVMGTVPPSRLPPHPMIVEDSEDRVRHARGQSLPDLIAIRSGYGLTFPDAVAYPTSDPEVHNLILYAKSVDARLIPYGGGSSVVGHINPVADDRPILTVDLSRLNRLRSLDATSGLATFGAGIMGPDLEAQLRMRGYTLGHFPQSFEFSTLGGWIATRSSGQQSLGYGRIETLFAGGRVDSPVGILRLAAFPASATGPDLREAVLGSEGRLGFLTEATVRVAPLPEKKVFQAVFFPEFSQGREAARQIVQARLPLSMVRLSTAAETQTMLALAGRERLSGALERMLRFRGAGGDKCMLMLGFAGRRSLVKVARKEAQGIASKYGGVHVGRTFSNQWHKDRFRTPYLRNTLWELGYAFDTLETAVDWARLPAMIEAAESALCSGLRMIGERVHVFTHLPHLYPNGSSVSISYLYRIASDPVETLRRWEVLKAAASKVIVAHGGTISHKHGIGTDHLSYLGQEKGFLGLAALEDLCKRFDPKGIMNPGKLII